MAGERIRLDFAEYDPRKAEWMLTCARVFATSKPDGRAGPRAGSVYTLGDGVGRPWLVCLAYWTKARMVVVAEEGS